MDRQSGKHVLHLPDNTYRTQYSTMLYRAYVIIGKSHQYHLPIVNISPDNEQIQKLRNSLLDTVPVHLSGSVPDSIAISFRKVDNSSRYVPQSCNHKLERSDGTAQQSVAGIGNNSYTVYPCTCHCSHFHHT